MSPSRLSFPGAHSGHIHLAGKAPCRGEIDKDRLPLISSCVERSIGERPPLKPIGMTKLSNLPVSPTTCAKTNLSPASPDSELFREDVDHLNLRLRDE